MYQVISFYKGQPRHEGFYKDVRTALDYSRWLEECVFKGLEYDDIYVLVEKVRCLF